MFAIFGLRFQSMEYIETYQNEDGEGERESFN